MSATLIEHYEYLSSGVRLGAYRQAVARAIRPGDIVVDVGCGFGILGLICLEAGAAEVWGIDRTDAIEIAREAMRRAGYAERYHCIAESSFRARLPVMADALICDHVGYLGFDYGIVPLIADARKRFLKPGGAILPDRLDLKLAAIAGPRLRAMGERWATAPIPEAYAWLTDHDANTKHAVSFSADEVASEVAALGTIDLRAADGEPLRFSAELVASQEAQLDGLGGWFDCRLSGDVRMTNSPLAAPRIDRPQAFLPFERPLAVQSGDSLSVSLTARLEDPMVLAWSARNARTGEQRRQTTWRSQILAPQDRTVQASRVAALGSLGTARLTLLSLIDGIRTEAELEDRLLAVHPDLFPSAEEVRRFVRSELHRNAR